MFSTAICIVHVGPRSAETATSLVGGFGSGLLQLSINEPLSNLLLAQPKILYWRWRVNFVDTMTKYVSVICFEAIPNALLE